MKRVILIALGATILACCPPGPVASAVRPVMAGESGLVDAIRPELGGVGGSARVYYAGTCSENGMLSLPFIGIDNPGQTSTGLQAIKNIFADDPNVVVDRDSSGMTRIRVGSVSDNLLRTSLSLVRFSERQQYFPWDAMSAIENTAEFRAAEMRLRLQSALHILDRAEPADFSRTDPHLPPTLRDVTVDQAFDLVAETFKGIVFYAACPGAPALYFAKYHGGADTP